MSKPGSRWNLTTHTHTHTHTHTQTQTHRHTHALTQFLPRKRRMLHLLSRKRGSPQQLPARKCAEKKKFPANVSSKIHSLIHELPEQQRRINMRDFSCYFCWRQNIFQVPSMSLLCYMTLDFDKRPNCRNKRLIILYDELKQLLIR